MANIHQTTLEAGGTFLPIIRIRVEGTLLGPEEEVSIQTNLCLIASRKTRRVVLDLTRLQRLGSDGISVVINATQSFRERGGCIALLVNDREMRTMAHLGLVTAKIISAFTDLDAAIEFLNPVPG